MPAILSDTEQSELKTRLNQFLDAIPFRDMALEIGGGENADSISATLEMYANESRVSLSLITADIKPDMQILEIGAGLCFTSLFLKSEGYKVTALEPAMGGFGMFEQLKSAVLGHFNDLQLEVIDCPAQRLNTGQHGNFDLIFSNNVIEHIPQWRQAFHAMTNVMAEEGKMIHACPNYSVPYEPHYGIPVFRRLPEMSRKLFLAADADPEIWESLNFITCKNIRNYCKSNNLACCFEKELLYKALKRIDDDPLFRERHQGAIATIASWIMKSGLGNLFRMIPPSMSTPMIVTISKHKVGL